VRGLAVTRGRVHVAVADEVCSVDLGMGRELARLAVPGASGIVCDATGDWLVGTARDVLHGRRTLGDRRMGSIATDADGRRLVFGSLGHEGYDPPAFVEVWDLAAERRLVDLPFEVGTPFVAISPDGARIAAVGESGAAIHREGTVVELRGGSLGVSCLWEVWRWTPPRG
jgi:hypothetical protein